MTKASPHFTAFRSLLLRVAAGCALVGTLTVLLGVDALVRRELRVRLHEVLDLVALRTELVHEIAPPLRVAYLDAAGRTRLTSSAFWELNAGDEMQRALQTGTARRMTDSGLRTVQVDRSADGNLEGFWVAELPFSVVSRWRWLFWGFAGVGGITAAGCWLCWRLQRPQLELLDAVQACRSGESRALSGFGVGHAFHEAAELTNRLLGDLERQSRIISEQHHQEQLLLNHISEAILVLDSELRITGMNPKTAQWLELGSPVRARGVALYKLCRQPTILNVIDEVLNTGEMREAHVQLERPGEEDRLVQVRGSLMVDRDQAVGVLILMRDVTKLRRLETLRQDFVANVSHELRTPLTSIRGYAEFLVEETEDAEAVKRYGERILMQSGRMVNIIDDLLALTRIENDPASTAREPTDLRPLLETVMGLCEDAAARRDVVLHLEAAEQLRVPMYAPLLEQAVLNLLQNAVKYTHAHTPVRLTAGVRGQEVVIEVADEGPGIAAPHLPRLFERFYRVDKARSRAVGGTGLGLSIVKHIAQLHQGRVEVESQLGKGSCFRLILPLESRS